MSRTRLQRRKPATSWQLRHFRRCQPVPQLFRFRPVAEGAKLITCWDTWSAPPCPAPGDIRCITPLDEIRLSPWMEILHRGGILFSRRIGPRFRLLPDPSRRQPPRMPHQFRTLKLNTTSLLPRRLRLSPRRTARTHFPAGWRKYDH